MGNSIWEISPPKNLVFFLDATLIYQNLRYSNQNLVQRGRMGQTLIACCEDENFAIMCKMSMQDFFLKIDKDEAKIVRSHNKKLLYIVFLAKWINIW